MLLGVVAAVAALGVFAITALAVHGEDFQLDGDVDSGTTTTVGGTTQELDWDSLFDEDGGELALPDGFTASGFHKDFEDDGDPPTFVTSDTSTYATGSKDTLPITPGWQCNFDNNVNSKIDVMNSYAAAFTADNGDELLYFALERNTNTGDANVGFWFLQDQVGCESTGGAEDFTGDHLDGDLLIVSAFTKGGTVSTIDVYRWDRFTGSGCDPADPQPGPDCVINPDGFPGSLRTTPVAHGVDCEDPNTDANDTACATANTGDITTPWLTANFKDGVGNSLRTAEFFEGGLNLTEENLGGRCFNTFLGDTRSSQSLTATLFDFSLGVLGQCNVSMTTEPSQTTRVLGSEDPIMDTATVVGATSGGGTAPTPTGTVSFFLCDPSELTPADTGTCQGDAGTAVPGNPVTVSESEPGTAEATSGDAQSLITGVGKYCFRATFTAAEDDPNYPGQTAETDNLADECFTVTGTAGLTTAQDWLPNDTATLTGDTNLNGTLTFTLYHDGTCGEDDGEVVYGPTEVEVDDAASPSTFSTDNSTEVVEADSGLYSWLVSYDDDTLEDPDDTCEVTDITITD